MTQISIKDMPNGGVPFQNIADSNTRQATMLLNENVVNVGGRCKQLEKAVVELQKKPSGTDSAALDAAVARAEAARDLAEDYRDTASDYATSAGNAYTNANQAKLDAIAAKEDAVDAQEAAEEAEGNASDSATAAGNSATAAGNSATAAGNSATAAGNSATAASDSADDAANSATEAADSATAAANSAASAATSAASSFCVAMRFCGVDLGTTYRTTFTLSDFGCSASHTYTVTAKFTQESTTARTVKLNSQTGSLAATAGSTVTLSANVSGGGSFTIDNIATTVNVVLCIKFKS